MAFIVQKLIWFLILPLTVILSLIATGLFLLNKRERTGKPVILAAVVLLYMLSLNCVAGQILRPLETRYPPLKGDGITADAVVVPGGGSTDLDWMQVDPVPNNETLSRLVLGVEWARKLEVPLVVCGGNGEPFATTLNDAEIMAKTAERLGMPRDRIIVENSSRNTLENSYAVRKLVKGNRIILATSAYYMRRAVAMFKKRGFTVIPAPTYFLEQPELFSINSFIPKAYHLHAASVGVAEWVSMAWWHIRGEI